MLLCHDHKLKQKALTALARKADFRTACVDEQVSYDGYVWRYTVWPRSDYRSHLTSFVAVSCFI